MKSSNAEHLTIEHGLCSKVKDGLHQGKNVQLGEWTAAENATLKTFKLLTAKPVVYLVSMNERDYKEKDNKFLPKIHTWVKEHGRGTIIPFSCVLESELAGMNAFEAGKYCREKQLQSALPVIIKIGFSAINHMYFSTAGSDVVKCQQIIYLAASLILCATLTAASLILYATLCITYTLC
ncbi:TGS domain-containing protein [Heracleum sosnowskyi]|uniref:TGS domain-containing protein n=1 Tax=Heracleum sosnowskyi TaxID=360622 RepID=A0AAD8HN78_9APIA|nr:TGS domain-containing protein [Heracleum sosnowskyi]